MIVDSRKTIKKIISIDYFLVNIYFSVLWLKIQKKRKYTKCNGNLRKVSSKRLSKTNIRITCLDSIYYEFK